MITLTTADHGCVQVEHCRANAEAMGSNPVRALNFFLGRVYDHLTSNLQQAILKNHVGDFS